MTWTEYVDDVSGSATPAEISRRTGISAPTVGRWKSGTAVSLDNVRKFVAGYRRPILEALVAAGFLTEAEAKVRRVETVKTLDIGTLTSEELAQEVLARMRRGEHRGNTAPIGSADFGEFQPDLPPEVGAGMDWETAIRDVQESAVLSDDDKLTTITAIRRIRDSDPSLNRESVAGPEASAGR